MNPRKMTGAIKTAQSTRKPNHLNKNRSNECNCMSSLLDRAVSVNVISKTLKIKLEKQLILTVKLVRMVLIVIFF